MKRPFFILAIFLIIFILAFRFFVKKNVLFPGHISYLVSQKQLHSAVKGTVTSNPFCKYLYFKKAQIFVVKPEAVKVSKEWLPAYGDIRVTSYSKNKVRYGDEILFEASLKMPFSREESSFDYKRYLERFNIYALAIISDKAPLIIMEHEKGNPLKNFVYNIKNVIERNIKNLYKTPEQYFLSAVLLGDRQDIPREWKDIFSKTQTMHLLAVSGLHVGIVAFIIFFLVGIFGLPRNFKCSVTIFVVIFYAVMVGGRPSVVRAAVMAVVFLSSYVFKRNADIYNSLGLAAVIILIYNPDQLFDYGFILSFVSVFFIIYMTPLLNRLFHIDKIKRAALLGNAAYYFSSLFSASCAVWFGLLPLSVNFFNIISPVSLIVNIFAIPALFVIISLSVFSLIIHPILPFLAVIFAEAAKFFIDVLILFLGLSSKIPFACFKVESQNIFAVAFYYMLLVSIIEFSKKKSISSILS